MELRLPPARASRVALRELPPPSRCDVVSDDQPRMCSSCGWLVLEPNWATGLPRCRRCNRLAVTFAVARRALGVRLDIHLLNIPPEARARAFAMSRDPVVRQRRRQAEAMPP